MSDWTTRDDIRKRAEREWVSGRLLAARVPGRESGGEGPATTEFPLRIPLRKPKSSDLSARFVEVQAWIDRLGSEPRFRVEFREVNHRVIGRQQLPAAAWLDSAEDALVLTGHTREAKRFDQLVLATPVEFHDWLRAHPLKALEAVADWEQILDVVAWIREHPRSGLYLRQVSLPGVHTKLIERHRRVIDSLLVSAGVPDAEAPGVEALGTQTVGTEAIAVEATDADVADAAEAVTVDAEAVSSDAGVVGAEVSGVGISGVGVSVRAFSNVSGAEVAEVEVPGHASGHRATGGRGWFERRYGFRSKPLLVRMRALDPNLELVPGAADLTMTATALSGHEPASDTVVLITENEINFLALPRKVGVLAIWGAGNRAPEALAEVGWLKHHRVYYWGDIDTHGFGILDRLRGVLPHVESFLMDREVLLAHRELWVREPSQMQRALSNLTVAENDLLQDLQQDKLGPNVRLEQELINYQDVVAAVAGLSTGGGPVPEAGHVPDEGPVARGGPATGVGPVPDDRLVSGGGPG